MWKYVRQYLFFAVLGGLFMVGEVTMDLLQPEIMSRIVDEGVLAGNMALIWRLGLQMIVLVLIGGLSGSLNNMFVHISSQNIGNEMRKDCFRRIMRFSFFQADAFGAGSLITRVTNDITQVQTFVSLLWRRRTASCCPRPTATTPLWPSAVPACPAVRSSAYPSPAPF